MIKLTSILLACIVLVQSINIDVDDLIQIDDLVEHAQFHSEKYEDNFFIFLSKHYGELKQDHNQEHQEEQPAHEQLPFGHQSCSQHSLVTFVFIPAPRMTLKWGQITDVSSNFFYQESSSLFEKQQVFQPPKFA